MSYPSNKLIFLDTETTGLDYSEDRIIQLACMKVEYMDYEGTWLDQATTWNNYFKVDCAISADSFQIHGISQDYLADKPTFSDKVDDFLQFIGNYTIIAHNASFDINFLNRELRMSKRQAMSNTIIDSIDIAREKYPGQSIRLDALMKKFGIPTRGNHNALDDVMILSKIYFMMIAEYKDELIGIDNADDFMGYNLYEGLIDSEIDI